ncbi:CBS domain-containing protein [Halorhodospira sp. 9622]|uniref:CBS domain-containing protein n=1 Tax=Halorhodospira sp. 9622 TaxID=2899136 RepID=UPI001EE87786|nr:CBS domain-containing protein [Halorhodospira sp. 9622]MCG5537458.1 CBS domain-containing protein [Halorhodospira sp. 9622]
MFDKPRTAATDTRHATDEAIARARRLAQQPIREAAREAQHTPLHAFARVARHLPRDVYRDLERRLPEERRQALRHLLTLPSACVGACQSDDFVPVNDAVPAAAAARMLDAHGGREAYVVQGDGRYRGVVARGVLQDAGETPVGRLAASRPSLEELDDAPHAVRTMDRAGTDELPVVDRYGRLTGVLRRAAVQTSAPERRGWLPRLGLGGRFRRGGARGQGG